MTQRIDPHPELRHLSPSSLDEFLSCPRHYYYSHVMGFRTPTNAAAWLGTAVHSTIEFFQIRRQDGVEESPKWIRDVFTDTFDNPDEEVDWKGWDKTQLRDGGITMTRLLHKEILSRPIPNRTEHSLWMDLSPGWGMLAYADWEETHGDDVCVVDLKTTGKRWSQEVSDQEIQSAILVTLTRQEHPDAAFVHLVATRPFPGRAPSIKEYKPVLGEARLEWPIVAARTAIASIEAGLFPPTSEKTNKYCNPKGCAYWSICKG
jgi:PD-(D/E)XK nuclease superfamily